MMAKKVTDTSTFQALEQDAYHAFIEWPLFLVRKIKQLEQHIAAAEENLKQDEVKKGMK
jgi:hypothetical protein